MAVQEKGRRAFVSMWILMALITSMAGHVIGDLSEYLNPIIIGVTNKRFTIQMPCLLEQTCEGISLKYKKKNDATWKTESFKPTSHINGLDGDAVYEVETIVKVNGTGDIKTLMINTCPENIPKPTGLRLVKSGPGWLDLRWNTMKEKCQSNIYYHVQYGQENKLFSPWRAYGVFEASDGRMIFRPTHPCATWDAEFCLLLTDYVNAGKNHTVKVKPVRYDPLEGIQENPSDLNEKKMEILKNVFADNKFTGPYILGQGDTHEPCRLQSRHGKLVETPAEAIKVPESQKNGTMEGRKHTVLVPMWTVILAIVLLISALVVLIVTWRVRKRRPKISKTASPEALPSISTPPVSAPNTNGHIGDDVDRASSMYDDCMTSVNKGTRPTPTPGTYHNEVVFSERFRGLQSAVAKEIVLASTSKVATKASTATDRANGSGTATTQLPVSDYYMSMEPQLIYDDAQGLNNFSGRIYENQSGEERESNMYMEPTSPIYHEAKAVLARESSVPYNEVYAHSPESPWRSW